MIASGCSSDLIFKNRPGKTFGEIYVGDARVSSRERLVNDRLVQDNWLKRQLDQSDQAEFGFSGEADLRSFSGTSTRIEANLDKSQIDVYRSQQGQAGDALRQQGAQAELDNMLLRQYKQRQLENLQQQPAAGFTYTPPAMGASKPAAATPPTTPSTSEEIKKQKDDFSKYTIDPSTIKMPDKIKPTPQEILRDKLEYRGMIRNEIIENALDDRHDLKGHTLLRFDLDATIRPENDTSAWAVIEVEVDLSKWKEQCAREAPEGLYQRWTDFLERDAIDKTLLIMRRAFPAGRIAMRDAASKSVVKQNEAYVAGMVSTLPDHILLEIQRDWIEDRNSPAIPISNLPHDIQGNFQADGKYATATAIILHRARGSRRADEMPMEDYVRELYQQVLDAYRGLVKGLIAMHVEPQKKGRGILGTMRKKEGVAQFCAALAKQIEVYSYATTPKETVQRIAEVASRRNFNEVMLALNFLVGNVAAGKAYFDYMKINEGIFQAIQRQPLTVGYSKGSTDEDGRRKTRFGWILGPRFGIRDDGQESNFRHTVAFNSLSGVLSLPGWLDEVDLNVRTYWVTEVGEIHNMKPESDRKTAAGSKTIKVRLKEDLTTITDALAVRSFRAPRAFVRQHLEFSEGSPAAVAIPGQNLWRSPTVLLGGQQADEITILPDMRGILAKFKEIRIPDTRENIEQLPLTVWTSEGSTEVALVKIKPLKPAAVPPKAELASAALIADEEMQIKLAPPQKRFHEMTVWVGASSSGETAKVPVTLVVDEGATAKFKAPSFKKAKTGEGALVQLMLKEAPDNREPQPFGGPLAAVYFLKADDTKASIQPAKLAVAKLDTAFVLTLPQKVSVIYPGSDGPVEVRLEAPAGSPELKVSACGPDPSKKDLKPGQCVFKVSLAAKDKPLTADTDYKVTVQTKDRKIPVKPEKITITLKAEAATTPAKDAAKSQSNAAPKLNKKKAAKN